MYFLFSSRKVNTIFSFSGEIYNLMENYVSFYTVVILVRFNVKHSCGNLDLFDAFRKSSTETYGIILQNGDSTEKTR